MSSSFFDDTKRQRGEVKHAILKYYLGGYFGHMGQVNKFDEVIYVDGFAGPGSYSSHGKKEDGSPLVAIKTLMNHMYLKNIKKVIMYFVENDPNHFKKLERVINEYRASETMDYDKIILIPKSGNFADIMSEILDEHESDGNNNTSPMLVFADPFGMKGLPFDIMKRIISRRNTELLVNVMYGFLNRRPDICEKVFQEFLGEVNNDWKDRVFGEGNEEKKYRFLQRYVNNLTVACPWDLYHFSFEIKNKTNRFIYHTLYLTSYIGNLDKMKHAMDKQSQSQCEFIFSEWCAKNGKFDRNLKNKLMTEKQIAEEVIVKIQNEFKDRMVRGKTISDFVIVHTPYLCNIKRTLKKDLKEYVVSSPAEKRFDHMIFNF